MKQFFNILKFEFLNYTKAKSFIILTVVLILLIGGVLSYPRFKKSGGQNTAPSGEKSTVAVMDMSGGNVNDTVNFLNGPPDMAYQFVAVNKDEEALKDDVKNQVYLSAIIIDPSAASLKYRYFVNDVAMNDTASYAIDQLLIAKYRADQLISLGISPADTQQILNPPVDKTVVQTGKNQITSFMYTYVLIFALYMSILLYGQFVATGVAAEKSSRAMELLITSAKPANLMFGKVIGSGSAGLLQMGLILGSGFVFYNVNKAYWGANMIVESIFGMPLSIILYALLFFILGFFIYAFMYGALGSLANRTEDVNALVMPVTFLMIIAFMFVMISMGTGKIDNTGMKILSYIPLTSPIAMFARISMSHVPTLGIIISVVILIATTFGIGYFAAGIYKIGVLLYGKTPKPKEIFKVLKNSR